jgi:trans-L-3-hydroxyproline dehydratase
MELNWNHYSPAKEAIVITTINTHTAGEPLRIITAGLPPLPGDTILEKRCYMQEHLDYIRKALMWEPRGHHKVAYQVYRRG